MSTPVRSAHITMVVCAVVGLIPCYFLSAPVVFNDASQRYYHAKTPTAERRAQLYLRMANSYADPYEWFIDHTPLKRVLLEYWVWSSDRVAGTIP